MVMKAKPKRQLLREDYSRAKTGVTVDADKGVIRGLKLCGLESSNGRRYPIEVLKAAIPLYEGVACYLNHPASKTETRNVLEHFGRFVNVRAAGDGLYGDLEYLKEHEHAARMIETAQRMPEQIGCSHNAEGDTEVREGVVIVTKLHEVRSVDIVADPATTNGLFEEKQPMKWTFKKLLESARKKFTAGQKAAVNKLLEDGDMADPLAAEVDEPAAEPADALSDGFKSAMYATIDKYIAGDTDLATALSQLKDLAKSHDKLVGSGGDDEAGDDGADDSVEEEDDEKKDDDAKLESRLRQLERRDACRDLCESVGYLPSKDELADLIKIDDAKARKRFVEALAAAGEKTKPADKKSGPRSRSERIREDRDDKKPLETKLFVEQLATA